MDRGNRSPTKKQTPALNNQFVSSTVIGISNSFYSLLCDVDHAMNETEQVVHKEDTQAAAEPKGDKEDSNIGLQAENSSSNGGTAGHVTGSKDVKSKDDGIARKSTGEDWTMVVRSSDRQNTSPNLQKQQQTVSVLGGRITVPKEFFSNSFDALLKSATNEHVVVPIMHISNLEVTRIIKESQVAMMNPMIKQPFVTLNTLAQNVPSQCFELFGEHSGGSGQPLLSTGNNNEVIRERSQVFREVTTKK